MTVQLGDADDGAPNVARIYDYLLGGAHNLAADRERAKALIAANPGMVPVAWGNRSFLQYAVQHALDLGVRQFLDLGSGIPTVGNVHEIAHDRDPDARVAYVDNEPVAVAHSAAVLADVPNATITDADLRHPDAVLAAPGVAELLDFSRPIALLAVAVLHFLSDADEPTTTLGRYRAALTPGSVLALTHSSADYPEHPDLVRVRADIIRLYANTSNPGYDRSRDAIRAMIEGAGFTVDHEGLRDIGRWGPAPHEGPLGLYAAITEPLA